MSALPSARLIRLPTLVYLTLGKVGLPVKLPGTFNIQTWTTAWDSFNTYRGFGLRSNLSFHIKSGATQGHLLTVEPDTTSRPFTPYPFASLLHHFQRPAAGTAIYFHPTSALHTCLRTFATRRKMPPKKQVEEKKILLGRPGNSLKSGIVCRTPRLAPLPHPATDNNCYSRSGSPMSGSRHYSKPSPNAHWVTRPSVAPKASLDITCA